MPNQNRNTEKSAQITEQVKSIKAEVDALQVHVMGVAKPWYKQAATLIATIALVFSFGTTFVSYYRTVQQDKHDAQVELRSLIQRIITLPRENFEVLQKYKAHPLEANKMSGFLNNESLLLSQQAAAIAEQIPELVSGAEYYAIGQGLIASGVVERGVELIEKAARQATTAAAAVAAYRSLGIAAYNNGQAERGKKAWLAALDIFKNRFPNASPIYQHFVHAQTLIRWAQVESLMGECESAKGHQEDAIKYFRSLPKTGSEQTILNELFQAKDLVSRCRAFERASSPSQ